MQVSKTLKGGTSWRRCRYGDPWPASRACRQHDFGLRRCPNVVTGDWCFTPKFRGPCRVRVKGDGAQALLCGVRCPSPTPPGDTRNHKFMPGSFRHGRTGSTHQPPPEKPGSRGVVATLSRVNRSSPTPTSTPCPVAEDENCIGRTTCPGKRGPFTVGRGRQGRSRR